jgi:hypothetical protein
VYFPSAVRRISGIFFKFLIRIEYQVDLKESKWVHFVNPILLGYSVCDAKTFDSEVRRRLRSDFNGMRSWQGVVNN